MRVPLKMDSPHLYFLLHYRGVWIDRNVGANGWGDGEFSELTEMFVGKLKKPRKNKIFGFKLYPYITIFFLFAAMLELQVFIKVLPPGLPPHINIIYTIFILFDTTNTSRTTSYWDPFFNGTEKWKIEF
jgi:hypothetical protein